MRIDDQRERFFVTYGTLKAGTCFEVLNVVFYEESVVGDILIKTDLTDDSGHFYAVNLRTGEHDKFLDNTPVFPISNSCCLIIK